MRRQTRLAAVWGLVAVVGVALAATARGEDEQPVAFEDSKVAFRFSDQRITESSGLAQSMRDQNLIWTNNDSGDSARIYGVDNRSGNTVATLGLKGATARDWEAMATCRNDDGDPVLWVGDVGDNIDGWKTYHLFAIDEPADPRDGEADYETYDVRYSDGEARDSEALLCNPKTGRLFLVSKESRGGVYRSPSRMRKGGTNTFEKIADAPSTVTDGVFLPDGDHAVLRGYQQAWVVDTKDSWKVIATFFPPLQIQGETVTVAADGKALLFGSEGLNSQVYRVELPPDLHQMQGTGDNPSGTQPTPTADNTSADQPTGETPQAEPSAVTATSDQPLAEPASHSEGIPGIDGPWVALLSVLALLAVALALVSRRD